LIYGTIKDTAGNPVLGLDCTAQQDVSGGQYEARGRSYATDGTYMLGVQTGTHWNVSIQNDTLWINGFSGPQQNIDVDLTTGCSTQLNMVITRMNLSAPSRLSANQFQFLLNGVGQRNYTVEVSSNLLNWSSLFVTNVTADSSYIVTPLAGSGQQLYRVLVGP